jgi:predicted metal-binding protein
MLNKKIKMIVKINPEDLSYLDGEKFCRLPYSNHPRGCPNYGKKAGCPPDMPSLKEILDLNQNIYLIYTEFNIGEHVEKMKELHPGWTDRQIYCCLYWQPRARKMQRQEEEKSRKEKGINLILTSPEAIGINLTSLMNNIGVRLEWPPRRITRLVSLGGMKK